MPRIIWVSFAPLTKTPAGWTSDLASARYRLLVPAAALQGEGWETQVTHLGRHSNQRTMLARFERCDAVVLGKIWFADLSVLRDLSKRIIDLAAHLQARGVKVIADFCDDHFAEPEIGSAYRAALNVADAAVASTPGLADVMREYGSSPVYIVTDPVEGSCGDALVRDLDMVPASPANPLRLLWYGHPSNVYYLGSAIRQLDRFKAQHPIRLTIVSAGGEVEEFAHDVDAAWSLSGSNCHFVRWSKDRAFSEIAACEVVVIPSNPHDPLKSVKSPNRFTEAIWAGRFTVAHPLPSYEELAPYGWVGEDLSAGLLWYAKNATGAKERIMRGQAEMLERFTPKAVARRWRDVIEAALQR